MRTKEIIVQEYYDEMCEYSGEYHSEKAQQLANEYKQVVGTDSKCLECGAIGDIDCNFH